MNITPFTIYLISRLTTINQVLEILTVISAIFTAAALFMLTVVSIDEGWESGFSILIRRFIRWTIVSLLVSSIPFFLVPTTKEAAAMIVIPRIVSSKTVQELGEGVVGLAKAWFEELGTDNKEKK